jgi:hypothetical protein
LSRSTARLSTWFRIEHHFVEHHPCGIEQEHRSAEHLASIYNDSAVAISGFYIISRIRFTLMTVL